MGVRSAKYPAHRHQGGKQGATGVVADLVTGILYRFFRKVRD